MTFQKALSPAPEFSGDLDSVMGKPALKPSEIAGNAGKRPLGARIKFEAERQRYTIQARDERFVLLTKPFNARRTYLYTIADLEWGYRGACNLIFGLPCAMDTPEGAAEALAMLQRDEMGVSSRNCVPLLPSEIAQIMEQSA